VLAVPRPVHGETGKICANVLQDEWSPNLTLHSLLPKLSTLLHQPNTASKENGLAGHLFNTSPELYWSHVCLTHERNMNERLGAH